MQRILAMAEIINLRKARKGRTRAVQAAKAAENRVKFGQPKHLREQAEAQDDLEARRLAAHRRETKPDDTDGQA